MKQETDIALIKKDISYMKNGIDDINNKLSCLGNEYVSKVEFDLTKKEQDKRTSQLEKLVFGAVGLAVLTLGKALLDLVTVVKAIQ